MLLGIKLRIKEIEKLEHAVTAVTDSDITNATFKLDVTASAEQIPKICSAMGLLLTMGLIKESLI
jgi:hypothetical protein